MANRQISPVGYRPFDVQPTVAEGLLSVAREGGDLERKVAMGLARLADEMGQQANAEAKRAGMLAGAQAGLSGAPEGAKVTGGQVTGSASTNGQAGHVVGAQVGVRVNSPLASAEAKAFLKSRSNKNASHIDGLNDGFAARIAGLFSSAPENIKAGLGIYSGARSVERQAELWQQALVKYGSEAEARKWVAPPGKSMHNHGTAADLSYNGQSLSRAPAHVVNWLHENAGNFGLKFPLGNENWHIEDGSTRGGVGYQSLPSAASVAPISVTPVREPVKIEPGKAGTFRPTGRDTVYGRAYDVAGTRTYLEMLDMAMEQNTTAIYEAYKDDPAKLEQALGEGLTAELRDNVFEEIAPEFTVAYRKRADGLLSKARTEQRKREEERNRVEFLGQVEDLENRKSQRMAGFDPSDPAAANDLAGLQSSIDARWDSAVARGIVDAQQAEKYKRSSRSDTTVGFYTAQAARLPADDIKAMRAAMTADYAAGKLAGVDAGDWDRIDKGLVAAESARRTQDQKASADLRKRGDDIAQRVARGLPVNPQDVARLQLDAGTAPNGREIVASTLVRMRVSEAIRTQPLGAIERNVKALVGENGSPEDLDFARKAIADHRADLRSDPLGVAERFGVLPVSNGLPLDGEIDPAAVSSAFSERINAARAAASHFGVSPKFFRPGEAEQIEATIKADPARGLDLAAGLVDAAGADADKILTELGDTAPALSLSGGLIASGGNRQAALDLISGFGKGPDGKAYADMPSTKRLPDAQRMVGSALAFTPSEVNRLDQAAAAIARKRLAEAGIDPKKEDAKPFYERAYQEAAGASFAGDVQYGGFADYVSPAWFGKKGRVLVPPAIRADKLADLFEALTDADIGTVKAKNGKAWTAQDFRKALPVAVKGGYAFAQGDITSGAPIFIADEKGDPIVLDLVGLRSALEPRVKGAYR